MHFHKNKCYNLCNFPGKASDFIAVELLRGKLHYILNLGYGPINIRDASSVTVSDNKWHEVSIGRPSRYRHTLMVDGHITEQNTQGDNYHLDLDGILFLGNLIWKINLYLNEWRDIIHFPKQIVIFCLADNS